jgi:hypothetical protein
MMKFTGLLVCMAGLALATQAQPFTGMFCPIDTAWGGKTIVVPPSPLRYDILLKEGDVAHNLDKGNNAPLKGGFGAVYFNQTQFGALTPVQGAMDIKYATNGWLYLTLRDNKQGTTGDGGGLVRTKVKRNTAGRWEVESQTEGGTTYNNRFFDLDALGSGVQSNGIHWGITGGVTNGSGNLFMYDGWAASNADISTGISDMNNYILPAGSPQAGLSIPRYQNTGWLTEVSRASGKPLRKLYHAGRGDFGGMLANSDVTAGATLATTLTVIYATQTQPSVLLKYDIADHKLYTFKQDANTNTGNWLLLNDRDVDGSIFPFPFSKLIDVQKLALEKGATMFNRLGGITGNVNDFYIAETGGNSDGDAFTNPTKIYNGKLAYHLQQRDPDNDRKFADPFGRILKVSTGPVSIKIEPYLEGGRTLDQRYTFSNPKQLSSVGFLYSYPSGSTAQTNGIAGYMVISEEVPNKEYNRNPPAANTQEDLMQEIYFLDMQKLNPKLSDLRPFSIGPRGAELQAAFSIDQKWSPLFLSVRYPNTTNDQPYHQSVVVAVSNFEEYFANPTGCGWVAPPTGGDTSLAVPGISILDDDFKVWPNPAQRTLYFGKTETVQLYDVNGKCVKSSDKTQSLNIIDLVPGVYFIRNSDGRSKKIVLQ